MQLTFYVELATRKQDKTVIDLLRFPEHDDVRSGEWSARWWSRGKTKRVRSTDREKMIHRLSADGINELDIKWNSRASDGREHAFRLVSSWILLSPTWGNADGCGFQRPASVACGRTTAKKLW